MSISHAAPDHTTYHNASMAERNAAADLLAIIEDPCSIPRIPPEFVLDLSEMSNTYPKSPSQGIHGTYLVHHRDAMLFGPNNLVTPDGYWSCESRNNKSYIIPYMHAPFYNRGFPGAKPIVEFDRLPTRLDTSNLRTEDVEIIEEPVFLATALEPPTWGRWITTVLPKVLHHRNHGLDRRFLCYAVSPWQRDFLLTVGLPEGSLLPHDPGRTYICHDVMTIEYSDLNLDFSSAERANLSEIIRSNGETHPRIPKIFVSRLSRSRAMPTYRALQNEAALAEALEAIGFVTIEPETLTIGQQIALFGQADVVVCLGGSGLYNAAFCRPDARIVTIESSAQFIGVHSAMLSSLRLRYGIIFGCEDPTDSNLSHKRWTLDIAPAVEAIGSFAA